MGLLVEVALRGRRRGAEGFGWREPIIVRNSHRLAKLAKTSVLPRENMPKPWTDYELLDFGDGRKLERLGTRVFDRPAPQAVNPQALARTAWNNVQGKYTGTKVGDGKWRFFAGGKLAPQAVEVPLDTNTPRSMRLALQPTPTGQVGLFPEQFANWNWIAKQAARKQPTLRVLNLFGYTGGSTLAAAAAGAEVTHVDASKPAVSAARENAASSGLEQAPIRWIVEDVLKYCRREVKRGSQYHGVILDPPTYGHGPGGEDWRLARDLPVLLNLCRQLTAEDRRFLLATCHTPGVGPAELAAYMSDGLFGSCAQPPNSGRLALVTRDGRRLESGVFARWPG